MRSLVSYRFYIKIWVYKNTRKYQIKNRRFTISHHAIIGNGQWNNNDRVNGQVCKYFSQLIILDLMFESRKILYLQLYRPNITSNNT